jgi:translocator protein
MAIGVAGLLLILLAVSCFALVLLHAFARSVGTGVMVLMLPPYSVVYGFTQFEHRRKGWVIAGWLGGFVAGIVLRSLSFVSH